MITERKALEICRDLWTWCAETGRHKNAWPGWEQHGGMPHERGDDEPDFEPMLNTCPCCEYAKGEGSEQNCMLCPLLECWGGLGEYPEGGIFCSNEGSLFMSGKWLVLPIRMCGSGLLLRSEMRQLGP